MSKKRWGEIAMGVIIHAQFLFNDCGIAAIDEVKSTLETALSIINMYDLRERNYLDGVVKRINSELCLQGYPQEVMTDF